MMSLPEEDLSCPICFDIFTDPVLLSCSHSFCRSCVKRCWETSSLRECPVCRKKASRSSPPSNRALKNLCEAHVKNRRHSVGKEVIVCDLHGEQFKLFCLVDMQPICVVCQSSKLHKDHDCVPIEETTLDCKDEVTTTLENLQDQLKKLSRIQENSGVILSHIKNQALETQRLIRNQFEQLHQALYDEESVKLAALKMEAEEKITAMKDKMSETAAEILCLTETIQTLEEKLRADDMIYMQNFKATLERGNSMKHGSENMPGALIDVSKHLCNLKYRIWEKMHDHLQYTPLTLDPNTAHPCLILSDDLTSLHYSSQPLCFPNNPERFHVSAEVVGTTALGSGSHRWIVETGNNHDWLLGVASASAPRDVEVSARPENGFWTLCLRDGELRAMTSPPTALAVTRKPCQVKVKLDYDKGTVSFFDSADDTVLYSFTHKFTETLLPYFYTQSTYPLKILPENVLCVTKLHR